MRKLNRKNNLARRAATWTAALLAVVCPSAALLAAEAKTWQKDELYKREVIRTAQGEVHLVVPRFEPGDRVSIGVQRSLTSEGGEAAAFALDQMRIEVGGQQYAVGGGFAEAVAPADGSALKLNLVDGLGTHVATGKAAPAPGQPVPDPRTPPVIPTPGTGDEPGLPDTPQPAPSFFDVFFEADPVCFELLPGPHRIEFRIDDVWAHPMARSPQAACFRIPPGPTGLVGYTLSRDGILERGTLRVVRHSTRLVQDRGQVQIEILMMGLQAMTDALGGTLSVQGLPPDAVEGGSPQQFTIDRRAITPQGTALLARRLLGTIAGRLAPMTVALQDAVLRPDFACCETNIRIMTKKVGGKDVPEAGVGGLEKKDEKGNTRIRITLSVRVEGFCSLTEKKEECVIQFRPRILKSDLQQASAENSKIYEKVPAENILEETLRVIGKPPKGHCKGEWVRGVLNIEYSALVKGKRDVKNPGLEVVLDPVKGDVWKGKSYQVSMSIPARGEGLRPPTVTEVPNMKYDCCEQDFQINTVGTQIGEAFERDGMVTVNFDLKIDLTANCAKRVNPEQKCKLFVTVSQDNLGVLGGVALAASNPGLPYQFECESGQHTVSWSFSGKITYKPDGKNWEIPKVRLNLLTKQGKGRNYFIEFQGGQRVGNTLSGVRVSLGELTKDPRDK